jgi:ubiquinone/menaquinone biosynthesis C-methylase UbiE
MIAAARRDCTAAGLDHRVTFEIADVASLPYPDATFDLVVSSMSLHHWADPPAAMRELRRVLRDAGQIWIYELALVEYALLPVAGPAGIVLRWVRGCCRFHPNLARVRDECK